MKRALALFKDEHSKENNPIEKDHSLRVSELCWEMGRALQLPEDGICKLKEAGYLHDIGKIMLEPKLFAGSDPLTSQTWNDIKSILLQNIESSPLFTIQPI